MGLIELAHTSLIGPDVIACSDGYTAPVSSKRPFSVRKATAEDCASILECLASAFAPFRESYTLGAFLDTVLTPESVLKRLQQMSIFVAVEAGTATIVGTIGCNTLRENQGHIRDMAVRPEWQGSLVAEELLGRVEQELRDRGCSRVTLNTTLPLQRAMRFYEKRGFHKTGRIANFYGMQLFEYEKTILGADTVLHEITRLLAQEEDRPRTARAIAETIRASGPHRWAGIYQVNLETGIVSNIGWSGPGPPSHPSFPITKGLTSRAIVSKKTVNIGDVASDADYLTALATTRSEIIIPVLDGRGDRVLGTIDVESERPHAFSSPTQKFLEKCAEALGHFWEF